MEMECRLTGLQVLHSYFEGKEDIADCGMYSGVKLLEHAMEIVENILEKRL